MILHHVDEVKPMAKANYKIKGWLGVKIALSIQSSLVAVFSAFSCETLLEGKDCGCFAALPVNGEL